jgi:hypothetical protein
MPVMKARLVRHDKGYDECDNIIEIKMWEVQVTPDKTHGYKYSLVYVVKGERVIGYDNAEGRGDHRHYRDRVEPYRLRAWVNLQRIFT